jgi:serine/threonine-protein kinase
VSSASGTLIRGAASPAQLDTPPVAATLPAGHDAARARPADRDPALAMATIPARPVTAAPPRARSTRLVAAAAIGGLALGVIAAARSMLAPAPATPSATPEAPAGSITATAASEVTVRLTVSPSSAEVRINDRRAGSASDPLVLPRSDKSLALRLEKDGYEPQTLWITPDRDRELPPVVLARSAPAAAPPGGIPGAGEAGTSSAKQPPRPKHHVDLERPPELGGGR